MKGIILAGGTGSRLFPLTKVTNKHLLPVGRYPMIYHPIGKMIGCGIEDILIVTGVEHMGDVVRLLGSGKAFGARFTYKVQDRPGGIAEALSLAEEFVGEEKMLVILADNVFQDNLSLTPSPRGEYEITDVNNLYIRYSILTYDILQGWWTDAGTHHSLLKANQYAEEICLDFPGGEGA